MGLDNGLMIKGKTIAGKEFLRDYCIEMKADYMPGWYELGYWRKCWNVRQRFLDVFEDKDYDGQGGEFNLTIAELIDVVEDVMKFFLEDEDRWNTYGGGIMAGGSIWEWHQGIRTIVDCIRNVREFLIAYQMYEGELSDDDFEIEFYDSY